MQKNLLVSGAGGALGKAVVNKFLEEDYFVAGIYHRKSDKEDSKISAGYVIDLADEHATGEQVRNIIKDLGKVDVLACIAGGFQIDSIENASAENIKKQIDLNFFTAYNLVQPFYNHMKKNGSGRIFLLGSRQGLSPQSGTGSLSYTLSKSLLFSLAAILNADNNSNVIVSVVVPSTIDTKANRNSMPQADFEKWVTPKSIADIIFFYASEKASAIRSPVIKVFNQS